MSSRRKIDSDNREMIDDVTISGLVTVPLINGRARRASRGPRRQLEKLEHYLFFKCFLKHNRASIKDLLRIAPNGRNSQTARVFSILAPLQISWLGIFCVPFG